METDIQLSHCCCVSVLLRSLLFDTGNIQNCNKIILSASDDLYPDVLFSFISMVFSSVSSQTLIHLIPSKDVKTLTHHTRSLHFKTMLLFCKSLRCVKPSYIWLSFMIWILSPSNHSVQVKTWRGSIYLLCCTDLEQTFKIYKTFF